MSILRNLKIIMTVRLNYAINHASPINHEFIGNSTVEKAIQAYVDGNFLEQNCLSIE